MRVQCSQAISMFCTMSRFKRFHCTLTANSSQREERWKKPTPLRWILFRILYWSFRNIFIAFKVKTFSPSKASSTQLLFPLSVFSATCLLGQTFQKLSHCLDIAADPRIRISVTVDQWIIRGWANFVEMMLIQSRDTISDLSRRCHPVSVSRAESLSHCWHSCGIYPSILPAR